MSGAANGDERAAREALFRAARERKCLELAQESVALRRAGGGRFAGPCPICGGDKRSTRFSISAGANVWYCHAEERGGGAIELEQALRGGTALEAAERLAGGIGPIPRAAPKKPDAARAAPSPAAPTQESPEQARLRRIEAAKRIWARAEPASGSGKQRGLVETYLAARGLDGGHPLVRGALAQLRFAPAALAGGEKDARGRWLWKREAPAMVAPIRAPDDWQIVGVHLTFLAADGSAKAALTDPDGAALPAKKMFGQSRGAGALLFDPGALAAPDAPPILIGEGIETTLSAAVLRGAPYLPIAALSLGNLQGEWMVDAYGRRDPDNPICDPARPGFAISHASGALVAIDADMAPVRIKRRGLTGGSVDAELDARARTRVCAQLACASWRAANEEREEPRIEAWAAPAGMDFNDALLRAREEAP